jgi:hypothetical protein
MREFCRLEDSSTLTCEVHLRVQSPVLTEETSSIRRRPQRAAGLALSIEPDLRGGQTIPRDPPMLAAVTEVNRERRGDLARSDYEREVERLVPVHVPECRPVPRDRRSRSESGDSTLMTPVTEIVPLSGVSSSASSMNDRTAPGLLGMMARGSRPTPCLASSSLSASDRLAQCASAPTRPRTPIWGSLGAGAGASPRARGERRAPSHARGRPPGTRARFALDRRAPRRRSGESGFPASSASAAACSRSHTAREGFRGIRPRSSAS